MWQTVLFSTVVEDVQSYCESTANTGFAIFHLAFSDEGKQRYHHLLLSLVAQVGYRQPGRTALQQQYEQPNKQMPDSAALEKIAVSCIASYEKFFLLLDALDESPENDDVRHNLLYRLEILVSRATGLRILATSRERQDIRSCMTSLGATIVPVATQSVETDIEQYVRSDLLRDQRLSRLDSETKTLIERTLTEKAGGM
jgi:hypothetical protein